MAQPDFDRSALDPSGPDPSDDGSRGAEAKPRMPTADDEARALRKRRRIAGVDDTPDTPVIGIALSGGGIRSATFCLGLLRGLARNGVLPRFDYLSTVSGGGYIGSMFGRLIARYGIRGAQQELARSDSLHLGWLRRYGRYLAPRGARDYGTAAATYLRAALAVHVEFAFVALLIAAVAVLPHVVQWRWGAFEPDLWRGWWTAWWPLAMGFWMLIAPGVIGTYWMLRDPPPKADGSGLDRPQFGIFDRFVTLAAGGLGVFLYVLWVGTELYPLQAAWWQWAAILSLLGLSASGIWTWAALRVRHRRYGTATVPVLRHVSTMMLRRANLIAVGMAVLGLLDWASWNLWFLLRTSQIGLFGGLGIGGILLVLLRTASDPLQKLTKPGDGAKPGAISLIFDLAGFGIALALLVLWATLAQWLVFGQKVPIECGLGLARLDAGLAGATRWLCDVFFTFGTQVRTAGEETVLFAPVLAWIGLLAFLFVWFVGTGTDAESVNTTSLHQMYRARLVRAYYGSVNWRRVRGYRFATGTADNIELLSNVTEVVEGDDVPLSKYRPASRGGPIHLIGVCLNQTRGFRSKLYNADRKGVPLVASAYGLEVGSDGAPPLRPTNPGTLGRWVAVSGAAASPGAGANTTSGWALLLFLAGARLGLWFEPKAGCAAASTRSPSGEGMKAALRDRIFAKYARMYAEARASYRGAQASSWYLSDGGHFDNTGVHALLRRELDFIVLADCGADPRYDFEDIENLVRKARIDFGADIEFYTAAEAEHLLGNPVRGIGFLSPEDVADNHTQRGVLLARIAYRADRDGMRKIGTLLVVKPNLHQALDNDLLAYARRQPKFPQQTTGDQFFDEAQWESYHHLGEDFGAHIRSEWLEQLPNWKTRLAPAQAQALSSLRPVGPPPNASAQAAAKPFWKIEAKDAAVGALSLGAVLTVALPAWQALDSFSRERENKRQEMIRLIDDVQAIIADAATSTEKPDTRHAHRLSESFKVERLMRLQQEFGTGSSEAQKADGLIRQIKELCPASAISHLCVQVEAVGDARRAEYWRPGEIDGGEEGRTTSPVSDAATAIKRESDSKPATEAGHTGIAPPPLTPPSTPTTGQTGATGTAQPPLPVTTPPQQTGVDDSPPRTGPVADTPRKTSTRSEDRKQTAKPDIGVACAAEEGRRMTVYAQVYDETGRDQLLHLPWRSIAPVVYLPGIENVNATAAARNADPPLRHPRPTLLVHRWQEDAECAQALARWLVQNSGMAEDEIEIKRLPGRYKGRKRLIEFWWPTRERAK